MKTSRIWVLGVFLSLACKYGLQAQTVEDLSGAALRQLVRAVKQATDEASKLALQQFRELKLGGESTAAPEDQLMALAPPGALQAQFSHLSALARNFPELAAPASYPNVPSENLPVRLPILTVDPESMMTYTSNWSPKRILSTPEEVLCLIFAGTEPSGAAILFKEGGAWKTEAFGSRKLAQPIVDNLRWDLPRQPDHEQYFVIRVPSVQRYYLARYDKSTIQCIFGGAHNDFSIPTAEVEPLRDFLPKLASFSRPGTTPGK
jgi:hypothetical protein